MEIEIMNEDDIDIPTWRQTHLGDEPIYCAAPPQSNPDDIICFGSDEELDESAKVAKRLRYEAKALDYLQGKPIHILSASLRGPFDKASGWKNPWLPKPSTAKAPIPNPSQLSSKPQLAIKQRALRRSRRIAQQDSTTTGTDNSIRCQFPSSSSNRESEAMSTPLETEKRIQIQAWAKNVSLGTLEKDAFWAPDQVHHEENTEPARKRPVGKDWLKGKQSKRKRIDNSQTTAAASTPMPMPRAQASTRSRSVPTSISHTKQPVPPSKAVSRSFELPTPSSTINQNAPDITHAGVDETSINHSSLSSQDDLSNASGVLQTEAITTADTYDQSLSTAKHGCEQTSGLGTSRSSKQAHRGGINQDQQNQEEERDLESYLDESFHYRARPVKKTTPIPDSDFPITATCPQLTQTGTPESPSHADAVAVATAEAKDLSPKKVLKSTSSDDNVSKRNEKISTTAPVEEASTEHQMALVEDSNPMLAKPDSASTTSDTSSTLSAEDGPVGANTVQDGLPLLPTIVETKDSGNSAPPTNHTTNEAHPIQSKPLVEEESLTDNPVADREPLKASELPATNYTLNSPITEAVLVAEPHDAVQPCENTAQDGSDSDSDSIIIPLSQVEWGFTEAMGSTPKKLEAIAKSDMAISITELPDGLEEGNSPQVALLDPPEIVTQRSPWVSDLPPGADLTAKHINGETPRLGPSQQSPWAGGFLEPVRSGDQGQHSPTPIGAIHADASLTTAAFEEHQSPWDNGNISITSYPQYLPVLSTPLAHNEGSLHPSFQSPMLATGPKQQPSGFQCDSPVTPPRAPASHASHVRTPELENSILPFAMFNTPSPRRERRQLSGRYSLPSHTRSILSSAKRSNPWNSARSSRRVSFAPLPTEDDDSNFLTASAPGVPTRAASPPPQVMADAEDEDVSGLFQTHFDIMKRRAGGEDMQLRQQPQLLPSFSQQKPSSPAFDAMAAAFQEADAHMVQGQDGLPRDMEENIDIDREMTDAPQSPWRKESQGVDDVAAVMNNLDEFLGAWDVEAELVKGTQETVRGSQSWGILG
ncbi:hypothetical protein F4821DRAFT_241500 [Hypoxylon rubiginosum]|uniref:Uncharacterized protein n=1 Tax=Hypoxylon rubiginosum TaxID=110542 RepID=A0ACC0CY98_9PEZI|nr:hypothetical protein F4821DRAFT_241500 [Hypoxylon rubiginosum]